jgi:Flp pilus assembly protein CpaB
MHSARSMPMTSGPTGRRSRARRLRLPFAALLFGCACAAVVGELRPAPALTSSVVVASRPLPAGHVVAGSDVRLASIPRDVVPSGAPHAADAIIGSALAVAVPEGLPLVDSLLARDLVEGPPGTVVAAVRLADAAVATLLAPGTHIDVLAATEDGTPGRSLARGALVLAPPGLADREPTGTGGLASSALVGGTAAEVSSPVLLAVTPDEAAALAGVGNSALLSAVIVK